MKCRSVLALALLAASVPAAWATVAPTVKAPVAPAAGRPSAPPRPLINLTATTAEPRRAQVRLASFANAVQAKNWKAAASYLSRRVTAAERQQLIAGPWLRPSGRKDPALLLYMPQIEIRTIVFRADRARLRILPFRWQAKRGQAIGMMDIWMLRENNRWMVDLHP